MIVTRTFNWGKIKYYSISGKLEIFKDGEVLSNQDAFACLDEMIFPFKAKFFVTTRCNHKCFYCFADRKRFGASSLSTDSIFKLIDNISAAGTFLLEIFGGEPFIRKDVFEILDYLQHKNIIVSIFTNGTLVDETTLI